MRILIVEDDRKLAEFVSRGLRAERFAVDIAENGRVGESYINSYDYDLLVLDLMLPLLSGTELLRRTRQSHPALPVLILTARDAIEDKVMHFEVGADDYLTKPFDFAELLVRIKALLRRAPVERADVLRIADRSSTASPNKSDAAVIESTSPQRNTRSSNTSCVRPVESSPEP